MSNKQEGAKHDGGKPRMDLLPYEAESQIAAVLAFGAAKYDDHNWKNGINYSRLIAAAKRHIGQYNSGIDVDEESGLSHIAHAAANLMFLLWMDQHRKDKDDRFKPSKE